METDIEVFRQEKNEQHWQIAALPTKQNKDVTLVGITVSFNQATLGKKSINMVAHSLKTNT